MDKGSIIATIVNHQNSVIATKPFRPFSAFPRSFPESK